MSIESVARLATTFGPDGLASALSEWGKSLTDLEVTLNSFDGILSLRETISGSALLQAPSDMRENLSEFVASVEQQPDQSSRAAAISFLHITQERLENSREAAAKEALIRHSRDVGRVIYNSYIAAYEEQLTLLYNTVEAEFSAYYRKINSDDESTFRASLRPSAGKLDMEVDFYGIGMFPPMAYHSEGHQGGMGVCLYLALMKHLLGDQFRLAVLDDVVMSVDSNHRKQFCSLLKEEFGDVQFVITTHDEFWAMQMQHAGLISKSAQVRFFSWSIDSGPIVEQVDFWGRIEDDLARENVPGAAATLRRNLEAVAGSLADSIGAKLFYKPAAGYELGEFLSGIRGRHVELLKKARKSANSWGNTAKLAEIQAISQSI
ncbi:MAG: hypothetical protein ACRDTE_16145 [Pseudonocardiaceae bacterium]